MGRRIGYARVSTADQDLALQKSALERNECAIIFEEKKSGAKRDGRAQLELALKVLIEGDTLVVLRLDRLGRSMRDLANIVHWSPSACGRAKCRHIDIGRPCIFRDVGRVRTV